MKILHLYYDLMNLYGEYGNVVVLEIKSGKAYQRHSAINNIKEIYKAKAVVFSKENVSFENDILYLPLYMLMFVEKENECSIDLNINKFKF